MDNERLSVIETKIDMHLVECAKINNHTAENIKHIYSNLGEIKEKLDLSLYKQDQHTEKHQLQEQNYFKVKLAVFTTISISLFSLFINLLM